MPLCVTRDRTPSTGHGPACRTMVTMRTHSRGRLEALPRAASLVVGVLFLGVSIATPQWAIADVGATTDPGVDALLQKRLVNPHVGSDIALMVIDAKTGELVSSHNADRLMLPASNMKIVTAVDALETMGADARFHTFVRAGTSPTDVILQGGGDPLLSSTDLRTLGAAASKEVPHDAKVTVHVDADLFPPVRRGPGWTNQYLPYVAAPVVPLARLGEYSPDPSGSAAKVFVSALRDNGVNARLGSPESARDDAIVLADASPHTVADAVAVMLRESENNVAEVLFRHVALATGHPATWQGANAAARETLAKLGIDDASMQLLDGSGLSRKDRVSPRFLSDVLRLARITRAEKFAPMFAANALPVSGKSGTLSSRFGRFTTKQSRCARGDVHAKTGSLFDTTALSGVAGTVSGGERVFSILVNHRPARYSALSTRQVLDGLTATITGCWG
jgi:D-alanyl-D-alanine carboxypeptidase/D-alanyl-D-alanine-endopeptidase (penicillin-binding protein 4)